jgi:hypothetical protein
MPQVGFKPMIPAFERAKRVLALDRAVTVIGFYEDFHNEISFIQTLKMKRIPLNLLVIRTKTNV